MQMQIPLVINFDALINCFDLLSNACPNRKHSFRFFLLRTSLRPHHLRCRFHHFSLYYVCIVILVIVINSFRFASRQPYNYNLEFDIICQRFSFFISVQQSKFSIFYLTLTQLSSNVIELVDGNSRNQQYQDNQNAYKETNDCRLEINLFIVNLTNSNKH